MNNNIDNKNSIYEYKFSIVMAVYNVEKYLREAVESLVHQTIGFESIQLILVNDGSPDRSPVICDEYAEKYPNNVVVIHKKNGGVSSARNEGLKHVKGELVNFLDSDDKLSENTLDEVWKFYLKNKLEIDLISIPLFFFEGAKGEHPLNVKFAKGTRVIDLKTEWNMPQLSGASTFFKASILKKYEFDIRLAYAEDAKLITQILTTNLKLGVVAEAKYLYRKRVGNNASAIQNSGKTRNWFMPCLEYFNEACIKYAKNTLGTIPLYVQNAVMHDLQWKFLQKSIPEGVMDSDEETEYLRRLFAILQDIENKVIFKQSPKEWAMLKIFNKENPNAKLMEIEEKEILLDTIEKQLKRLMKMFLINQH